MTKEYYKNGRLVPDKILTPKGRVTYVPHSVFGELKNIMDEDNVSKPAIAFTKMVEYSRVGREARKLKDFFMIGGK